MKPHRRTLEASTLLLAAVVATTCTSKQPAGTQAQAQPVVDPKPASASAVTTTADPGESTDTSDTSQDLDPTASSQGSNDARPALQIRPRTLATRGNHVCALIAHGEVACWGGGDRGQVAPAIHHSQPTPVRVPGITQAVGLAASHVESCALLHSGEIVCWGGNQPKVWRTKALGDVADIVVSPYGRMLCGLRRDGTIACTPLNLAKSAMPQAVPGIDDAIALDLAGDSFCALRANQSLECWKPPSPSAAPEIQPTPRATGVVEAAASGTYHCYKTSEGRQYCATYGEHRPVTPPVQGPLWKAKVPGEVWADVSDDVRALQLTCQRDQAGYVSCFGVNQFGEVGTGKVGFRASPVPRFTNQTEISGIALGGDETCIYHADHELTCENNLSGWENPGIAGVRRVALSGHHACAIVGGGQLRCWGLNLYGELGVAGDPDDAVRVPKLSDATAVAVGEEHTCASIRNGPTYCWGINDKGQLGNGQVDASEAHEDDEEDEQPKDPVRVQGLTQTVDSLALGYGYSLARTPAGIFAWGEVPNMLAVDDDSSPTATLIAPGTFTGLWATDMSFCALRNDGAVLCGGEIADTASAIEDPDDEPEPNQNLLWPIKKVSPKVADVALGLQHACVLTTGGKVMCWGDNDEGQLGNGTSEPSEELSIVQGLTGVTGIEAGDNHTCAYTKDRRVFCWGSAQAPVDELVVKKPQKVVELAPYTVPETNPAPETKP